MTFPFRFLRALTAELPGSDLRLAARTDLQWGRRVFQAPSLPLPRLPMHEVQFSPAFRSKDRRRG